MEQLTQQERGAVARLHALLELLPAELDKRLATAGVTLFEYTVLEALDNAEWQRMRLSTLAGRTNATLPRLSRVVTSLERRGLAVRAACEADGRATNAVLTPAGADAYRQAQPLFEQAMRSIVLDAVTDRGGPEGLAGVADAVLARLEFDRPDLPAARQVS